MPWAEVKPAYDPAVRKICWREYAGHPKGCPNHGNRRDCPPMAPLLPDILDLDRPVYVIWNCFDFGKHRARMQERHPKWSERQLRCCLYWQGTARKQLRGQVQIFMFQHKDLHIIMTPEAMGVNITATMKRLGITLEWPPETITYQVALGGHRKK